MRGKRSPSCLAASRPDSPDHPRACGANSFTPAFNWPSTGSSPRMRGKLICRFCRRCRMRIIPAHAGQTTRTTSCPARYPDHPRACGANLGKIGSLFGSFGSSPRVRGKRRPRPCPRTPVRIIPAHAGQTSGSRWGLDGNADHPRACGANAPVHVAARDPAGSSPRMRGKPVRSRRLRARRRIIPAHAGQTNSVPAKRSSHADHPRACGANVMVPSACMLMVGSSPRMRGKRHPPSPCNPVMRIIPAHAGQTVSNSSRTSARSDHPRACGANKGAGGNLNGRYGSSPRMRGKPHQRVMPPAGRRIIPAHAGQTRALARPDQRRTDHPRACGANSSGAFSMIRLIGSSPRMRGKRVGSVPVGILARIIPAHAGQTQSHQRNGKEDADHPRACGANNGNN